MSFRGKNYELTQFMLKKGRKESHFVCKTRKMLQYYPDAVTSCYPSTSYNYNFNWSQKHRFMWCVGFKPEVLISGKQVLPLADSHWIFILVYVKRLNVWFYTFFYKPLGSFPKYQNTASLNVLSAQLPM